MSNLVRYDVSDRVAVLTIDNPPVNALSPAMWDAIDGDESETSLLAAAQQAKLAYHLDQANVADGAHLLDVGCGWGSLVSLAQHDGHETQVRLIVQGHSIERFMATEDDAVAVAINKPKARVEERARVQRGVRR